MVVYPKLYDLRQLLVKADFYKVILSTLVSYVITF